MWSSTIPPRATKTDPPSPIAVSIIASTILLKPDGSYQNFSGTGNTFNAIIPSCASSCSMPALLGQRIHIDGFRFDLAASMGRDPPGVPDPNPPLLEVLAYDPILAHTKLIAEAWDAGGLYQVGSFPPTDAGPNGTVASAMMCAASSRATPAWSAPWPPASRGSPDIYGDRGPRASVNFITAHDGFTLRDLVSYNQKRNWPTAKTTAMASMTISAGIAAGRGHGRRRRQSIAPTPDEELPQHPAGQPGRAHALYGRRNRAQQGGQQQQLLPRQPLNYFDWQQLRAQSTLFQFVRHLIQFPRRAPGSAPAQLPQPSSQRQRQRPAAGQHILPRPADLGARLGQAKPELAVLFCGSATGAEDLPQDIVYIIMNAHWEAAGFELPRMPAAWPGTSPSIPACRRPMTATRPAPKSSRRPNRHARRRARRRHSGRALIHPRRHNPPTNRPSDQPVSRLLPGN